MQKWKGGGGEIRREWVQSKPFQDYPKNKTIQVCCIWTFDEVSSHACRKVLPEESGHCTLFVVEYLHANQPHLVLFSAVQTMGDYLVDNEARVRDVELLTGLHFFPALPFTQAVAMRTYLPSGLWPLLSLWVGGGGRGASTLS